MQGRFPVLIFLMLALILHPNSRNECKIYLVTVLISYYYQLMLFFLVSGLFAYSGKFLYFIFSSVFKRTKTIYQRYPKQYVICKNTDRGSVKKGLIKITIQQKICFPDFFFHRILRSIRRTLRICMISFLGKLSFFVRQLFWRCENLSCAVLITKGYSKC